MSRFNEQQLTAIKHFSGPAMVIAGPGSGKTTVITNRIRYLIFERKIPPEQLLVITFTAAAAEEMRSRYLKLCDLTGTKVTFGTFHSVFLQFLIRYSGFSKFRLASAEESVSILRSVFQKHHPDRNYTSDFFEHLLGSISRFKNGLGTSDPFLRDIVLEYDRLLHAGQLMDFDDMLTCCLQMLKSDPSVLESLRSEYRFLMVDEFQDINPVQFECVRLLAAPSDNLFVVGDDDQSIYAFRGSDPGIMLSFRKYYPKVRFLELLYNYRSSETIVQSASRVIRHNKKRYAKEFRPMNQGGARVLVRSFYDMEEEANVIAAEIAHLPDEVKSVGILFRKHRDALAVRKAVGTKVKDGSICRKEISFLTFHSSKGLEFDVVYMINVQEQEPRHGEEPAAFYEEERRLFYVAMTRARRILHISYTKYHYNKRHKKSRFLKEI